MLGIFFVFGCLGFLSLLGHFIDQSAGTFILAFVEEKFGAFSHLLMYCLLEWFVIILIYVDGFLSFASNEVSRLFELRIPCLLCTRIDHVLIQGSSNLYYNESICEAHKKFVSSLAYCNAHKKLSNSGSMCQGCLLSFATERDSEIDRYKSIVGILHKDVDFLLEDEKLRVKALKKDETEGENVSDEESGVLKCSCCGEPLKSRKSFERSFSINAPAPSPRSPFGPNRNEEGGNVDGELELPEDGDALNADTHGKVDAKAATAPLLPEFDDMNEDTTRTPSFAKGKKYLGTVLSDVAQMSPRWARKPTIEKVKSLPELNDASEADGDIITSLKRQVELNRKSLTALYMELDEERSASAVAANNAMAMITRLQAEKAAVQMEALQYQRMKQEQAEYDQEALQAMKDLLLKREEGIKALEAELEMYREKYGDIKNATGSEICEVDDEEDYQDIKSRALSTSSEKSESGSVNAADLNENENIKCGEYGNTDEELSVDFEGERSYLLGLLKNLEGNSSDPVNDHPDSTEVVDVKPEDENKASSEVQNKAMFTRELSLIRDRLRVIEADSGFVKHTAMTQGEGEGTKLLTEIAQHVRELRQPDKLPSEATDA